MFGVTFEELEQLVLEIISPLQLEPPKRDSDGTTDADGNYVPPAFPRIQSETGADAHDSTGVEGMVQCLSNCFLLSVSTHWCWVCMYEQVNSSGTAGTRATPTAMI